MRFGEKVDMMVEMAPIFSFNELLFTALFARYGLRQRFHPASKARFDPPWEEAPADTETGFDLRTQLSTSPRTLEVGHRNGLQAREFLLKAGMVEGLPTMPLLNLLLKLA